MIGKQKLGIVFFLVGALAIAGSAFAQADQKAAPSPLKWTKAEIKAVTGWLKASAVPLTSVTAGAGFDDLQPLKALLKDVRVVGLGEATHGTREFFQFKHRMLEFLVKEMGFTLFAIEASYPACWNINEYVLTGKGDPAAALASQGFWTWDTNEVADMIQWMKEYNRTVPEERKVKFLGYDIQHLGRVMTVVESFLGKVNPGALPAAKNALEPLIDAKRVMELKKNPEERDKLSIAYRRFLASMAFNRTPYVMGSSPAEYEYVMQHIRVIGQFFESYALEPATVEEAAKYSRDLFMAENAWLLLQNEAPGTKMVVWAHNGHIDKGSLFGIPSMGALLKKYFGEAYYALGFSFNKGSFQSCNMDSGYALTEFSVGTAPEGSIDAFLARPGIPLYFIDVRGGSKDPAVDKWLKTEMPMRSIGSGYTVKSPDNFFAPTRIEAEYDGLVYFGTTTRAIPNPTGMRPLKKAS